MKSTILGALVGLNLILLLAFVARVWQETPAYAQNQRIGDYMLVPGEVTGQPNDVVYIVDIANRQLGAMMYDDANKRISWIPTIDLNRIFERGGESVPARRR